MAEGVLQVVLSRAVTSTKRDGGDGVPGVLRPQVKSQGPGIPRIVALSKLLRLCFSLLPIKRSDQISVNVCYRLKAIDRLTPQSFIISRGWFRQKWPFIGSSRGRLRTDQLVSLFLPLIATPLPFILHTVTK